MAADYGGGRARAAPGDTLGGSPRGEPAVLDVGCSAAPAFPGELSPGLSIPEALPRVQGAAEESKDVMGCREVRAESKDGPFCGVRGPPSSRARPFDLPRPKGARIEGAPEGAVNSGSS